jgi:glutamate synthase (NADPH/NADH) small chain
MDYLHAAVDRQQFGIESELPGAAGRDVIVIGTGNTATDCVATAIRQGCRSVIQLVRRGREDYVDSAGKLPQDYAQEEAEALFGQDPRVFRQSVASLQADEAGQLQAIVTKSGEQLPCQLLIGATGFAGCRADVCEAFGVERKHPVVTEAGRYRTSVPHSFTAGDMHRGQSLVVHAIAEGRAAAIEVDRFLMGYTNLI